MCGPPRRLRTWSSLKVEEAVAKEHVGPAFSQAKAAIAMAKTALAVRSCSMAIADDKPQTPTAPKGSTSSCRRMR